MLRYNFLTLYVLFLLFIMLRTQPVIAVVDLGASEIQSKQDAPEAVMFITRAPLDESVRVTKTDGEAKIKEGIETSKLFDLVH